ncbi:hypothetical protein D3C85_1172340 [compost metagenome]
MNPRKLEKGRSEVIYTGYAALDPLAKQPIRQVNNRRNTHPTLSSASLEQMKWCRANLSPTHAIVNLRTAPAQIAVAVIVMLSSWIEQRMVFTRGAVVGHKHNDCVVVLTALTQVFNQAPDVVVEVVHHRCINFHFASFDPLLLGTQLIPVWRLRSSGERLRGIEAFRQQTEFLHTVDACNSNAVMALVITSAILIQISIGGLKRPVWSRECGVGKKRFAILTGIF